MLVVLDPGFFREDGIDSTDAARRSVASLRLRERLDDANSLLLQPATQLVVAVDSLRWFDSIYRYEARAIEDVAERPLKQALARLREHRKHGRTLSPTVLLGKMWGVALMADWLPLGRTWRAQLESVLAAAVQTAARESLPLLFLCNRINGRNVRDRSSKEVELMEVLRWRLSASIRGAPPTTVPCVGKRRHVEVPWTRRMDDRLPDLHGPGRHPYCPLPDWMNSQTKVWGTHQSRPCWLDAQRQWWARPATGGGYHWDVYLNSDETTRLGLPQVNITQHGAPADQGEPGDLHHVPTKKRHALKETSGWRCPR